GCAVVAPHKERVIGLEAPVPNKQEKKGDGKRPHRPKGTKKVASDEDRPAYQDATPVPQMPVGDPAADERSEVNKHQVVGPESSGLVLGPAEPLGPVLEEQGHDRRNRVEAKPLPHLSRKQEEESSG